MNPFVQNQQFTPTTIKDFPPKPQFGLEKELRPGQIIDSRYKLIGILGSGGMGTVFDAEHVALGKKVVVKVLHSKFCHRADLIDRLRVEAQVLSELNHPNLVTVSDFGQIGNGRPYLVMERLYGHTLRKEIEMRGSLPFREAIQYILQVLEALSVAHESGIIHRDIKLDNIFVCRSIRGDISLKVLDFGIVKVTSQGAEQKVKPVNFPTEEGIALGTPRFFSPEQGSGKRVDKRTDLYAVGTVLYTLLVGKDPFAHHKGFANLLKAHIQEQPIAPSLVSDKKFPKVLDEIILKSLAKSPEDRFSTALELIAELQKILDTSQEKKFPIQSVIGLERKFPFLSSKIGIAPKKETPKSKSQHVQQPHSLPKNSSDSESKVRRKNHKKVKIIASPIVEKKGQQENELLLLEGNENRAKYLNILLFVVSALFFAVGMAILLKLR